MSTPIQISPRPSLETATRILRDAALPTEDLTRAHVEHFFFSGPADQPTGLVGLEVFGDVALLRSLAVVPGRRGQGEGQQLLSHAEREAAAKGVRAIYLLTTTAEQFFSRFGYSRTSREDAPAAIKSTREFVGICPASAAFMAKHLQEADMTERPFNVLILCTGNSARSILGEALINHWGKGKFVGYSAGSTPKGKVHPIALQLLEHMKMPTAGMRSKSWDEFAQPGAPQLDFVFTVCDNAAGEMCPVWPAQPMTAHWGIEDPAAVEGSETDKWLAFRKAFHELESRIKVFTSLPIRTLEKAKLQARLNEIGRMPANDEVA